MVEHHGSVIAGAQVIVDGHFWPWCFITKTCQTSSFYPFVNESALAKASSHNSHTCSSGSADSILEAVIASTTSQCACGCYGECTYTVYQLAPVDNQVTKVVEVNVVDHGKDGNGLGYASSIAPPLLDIDNPMAEILITNFHLIMILIKP